MKIVVIGPGALGCLFSTILSEKGQTKIKLFDHNAERAARLAAQGILLERDGKVQRFSLPVTADLKSLGRPNAILLCVKSHQVSDALTLAGPLFSKNTLLLALQNGIAHIPILAGFDKNPLWAAGVTSLGATLLGEGHVRYAGQGMTRIGFFGDSVHRHSAQLSELAALFSEAGLKTEVVDNILAHLWAKLFINIGINALTAIYDCPNGKLLESAAVRQTMLAAVLEAMQVAQAKGIPINGDPVHATLEVCRATAGNISSMLQDVRNKRPTEIDAINGALVREAKRQGIPVPVNESLVQQLHELELAYNIKN